ncbi:MAG: hypothetical protein ABW003_02555 [Microvirga sp.]
MHTLAEAITRHPVPWNRGRPYHIAVATFDPLYPNLVGRKDLAPANVAALLDWLKGPGSRATSGQPVSLRCPTSAADCWPMPRALS